jgi:hypothetical protein
MTVASPRSPLFARAPFWVVVAGVTLCVGVALGLTVPDFTSGRWVGAQWEAVPRSVSPLPLRGAGAVLLPSQAASVAHPCSRPGPPVVRRGWTPTPAQINHLEADLAPLLTSIADTLTVEHGETRPPLRDYYRQYIGLELVTDERVIYVNAFAPLILTTLAEHGRDADWWKREPARVCDGWRAYWGVEYDPSSRRFRGFSFDGRG